MNEGESAASFCCQVAAWVPDLFCNLYFVKYPKVAKDFATTKAREKIAQIWNTQNFRNFLIHVGQNFKTIKFYFTKLATDFY